MLYKRKIFLFVIAVVILILLNPFDKRYALIGVRDEISRDYVYEPEIAAFPNIALEGQPGTGAKGPYLYKPLIPMPVIADVSAEGYKNSRKFIILIKGRESTIYLKGQ